MKEKKLVTGNGKYTFYIDENCLLKCARYNAKRWRNFTGDNAILCLFYEALESKQKLNEIANLIGESANNTFNSNTTEGKLLEAISTLQKIFNVIREKE